MLWLRAWLETRTRIAFTLVWLAFFVGVLAASAAQRREGGTLDVVQTLNMLAFPCLFVPVWLAGSGVRTQSGMGRTATRGLHGSTHVTLSLPVTRARLLAVRSALGLVEAAGVIAVLGVAAWLVLPALRATAVSDGLRHLLVVFVTGTAFYGLSVLAATLLDEMWQMWASTLVILALWSAPVRGLMPQAFDVFRPLSAASPLVTHTLPWTAMLVALVAGALFTLAALKVIEAQEY
jgi:FtsH-binding integral membrane protein